MIDHPDTIKHPENFDKSQWHIVCPYCHYEIGFDGIFHWGWVIDGIKQSDPKSKIMPMDFDAVIERHYHYLIIETKDEDVPISEAQSWTLTRIKKAKSFTIFKVFGKVEPKVIEIISPQGKLSTHHGNEARELVKKWFDFANGDHRLSGES